MSAQHATEPERQTLTIEEAAKVLGIGRTTAWKLAWDGTLPTIRLGRRLVVPRARLEAMLKEPSA